MHAFSHFSDDDQTQTDCELCEIINVTNQLTPCAENVFIDTEQKIIVVFKEQKIIFCYETSEYSITLPKSVHNKPPPTFLI